MITETREIYKCGFCRKVYQVKNAALNHEDVCSKNPETHTACVLCKHLVKKDVLIYTGIDEYHSHEPINTSKQFFYCKAKEKFMYTKKNEAKGNHYHVDENGNNLENILMPKECSDFTGSWL